MKRIFLAILLSISTMVLISCGDSVDNLISSGQMELHHIFPQEFRADFEKAGINVDDFAIALSKEAHRGAGSGIQYIPSNWNDVWKQYLINNPNATQRQMYNQVEKMLSQAGGRGEFRFYNYNTRQLSNAKIGGHSSIESIGQNGFWRFVGSLGRWLMGLFGENSRIIGLLAGLGTWILGFLGIKMEHPVTVGLGFLVIIFGILGLIGIIYLTFLLGIGKGILFLLGCLAGGFIIGWVGSLIAES